MHRVRYQVLGLGLVFCVGLAGCMDGGNATGSGSGTSSRAVGTVEQDVEDPTVFSRRETGLWDGRPSLGGGWVAHPDATSPERVIIRNTENGRSTVGALFRRERMNPGPAFQISGEAANELGVLAGAPTMIEVVALRTEEIAIEGPAPEPAPDLAPEASPVAQPAGEVVAEPGMVELAEDGTAQPPAPAQQQRGGFLSRLFGSNRSATPPATGDEIATTELDALPAGAAPAAPLREATAQPQPAPQPAAPAPASSLDRPFIQLGIFSVEANARNAERMASGAGLSARSVAGTAQGNAFWRVIVGPAQSSAEQTQMLARVRALGFNDAYAVRR